MCHISIGLVVASSYRVAALACLQRRGARLNAGDITVEGESPVDIRGLVTGGERARCRGSAGQAVEAPNLFRVPLEDVQRAQLARFEQRHQQDPDSADVFGLDDQAVRWKT